jgi:hypothetical protein
MRKFHTDVEDHNRLDPPRLNDAAVREPITHVSVRLHIGSASRVTRRLTCRKCELVEG